MGEVPDQERNASFQALKAAISMFQPRTDVFVVSIRNRKNRTDPTHTIVPVGR